MIAVVDYGVGNLFSIKSSLAFIGEQACVTGDESVLKNADKIILPGVGAFEDAVRKLRESGLDGVIVDEAKNGKPLLGICLGMQMLFEKSYEYGVHQGLGLIDGDVMQIADVIDKDLKIPHIGWNPLIFSRCMPTSSLFKYIKEGDSVYFVHSYYAATSEKYVSAYSEYGGILTASVENGNVYGTQFHPEKSGKTGLAILKAFCEKR